MHSTNSPSILICGAGMAGIAAAYHLTVRRGVRDVVLVDDLPPLSLTSDKSTECYRNWWPGPGDAMVALTNRSIDLMEEMARESGNLFGLNRRGYLYATGNAARVPQFRAAAEEAAALGAGPVRYHSGAPDEAPYQPAPAHGFAGQPTGCDLITGISLIRQHFPALSERTAAVIHARRCGWLSAQQMGMYMRQEARQHGARLIAGRVTGVEVRAGRVQSVRLRGPEAPERLVVESFVNAAGPHVREVGRMLGVDLPVLWERHAKIAFRDPLGAVPRDAPLLVWTDPQTLDWSAEERELFAESADTRALLGELPGGAHVRPEGGADSPMTLMLWAYDTPPVQPVFPVPMDPAYPEVTLRGLTAMLPGLGRYLGHAPRPIMDGGYYCKTRENRPLVGPLPVKGAYIAGALSGFGVMASAGAGDLLAAHITGGTLPHYAGAFRLERYEDPAYQELLANWPTTGQL
jgi:glycine/D-amino acid oxidase-like deaminating enzyme